jgi:putative ABC transport system permease protein
MLKPLAATAVVLMAVILSYMQKLGLEGEMVYSIIRSFLQLSVIGFVLQFIFNQDHAVWIILAYLFMVRINLFSLLFLFYINFFTWKFCIF